MLAVRQAEYAGGYALRLSFNDGGHGVADLERTVFDDQLRAFSKLRDQAAFKRFRVGCSTVIWSDELDLAAEYLYYLAFKGDPVLQERFRAWGYIA